MLANTDPDGASARSLTFHAVHALAFSCWVTSSEHPQEGARDMERQWLLLSDRRVAS